ncbi:hypothetical protein ID852_20450 [Xenorhabdus sp. 42]|nr:hypothetical protein [Xenorhabdus sp. 42]
MSPFLLHRPVARQWVKNKRNKSVRGEKVPVKALSSSNTGFKSVEKPVWLCSEHLPPGGVTW